MNGADYSQLQRDLGMLCSSDAAGRLSGTEGAYRTAAHLARALGAAGYRPVSPSGYRHSVPVPAARLVERVSLSVAGRTLQHRVDFGHWSSVSSGGAGAGPLLVVRDGDSLAPADVAGRIGLIAERPADFDLSSTVAAAADLGLVALLVEYGEPRWFHKTVLPGQGRVPVLRVRTALAAELSQAADAPVALDVPVVTDTLTCHNVYGLLPGRRTEHTVVLAAHYDHVGDDPGGPRFPGAWDNASGVATMLAVARELATRATALPFNILVAFLTGEESGLWGARHLAAAPPLPLSVVLNVDGLGSEAGLFKVRVGQTTRSDWFAELATTVLENRGSQVEWASGQDDSIAFLAAGLPTIGLGEHYACPGGLTAHTPDDEPATLCIDTLMAGAAAIVDIVSCLAEDSSWQKTVYTQGGRTHVGRDRDTARNPDQEGNRRGGQSVPVLQPTGGSSWRAGPTRYRRSHG